MRGRWKIGGGGGQLRPVLVMLAVAVILPAVCLLWFMNRAVENVRMAARQIVIDRYEGDLTDTSQKANGIWKENLKFLDKKITDKGAFEIFNDITGLDYDGAIIYDKTGGRIYPLLSSDVNTPAELGDTFAQAWRVEFVEQDYAKAAELYEQKARSKNIYVKFTALIGESRSLTKLSELDKAISTCRQVAFSSEEKNCDIPTLTLIANARLLLMELLHQNVKDKGSLVRDTFIKLLEIIHEKNEGRSVLPSEQRAFLARRICEIYEQSPFLKSQPRSLDNESMQKLIAAEELSIRMVERFPTVMALPNWPNGRLKSVAKEKESVYGMRHDINGRTILLFRYEKNAIRALWHYENTFKDSDMVYRILDDSGRFLTGAPRPEGEPFITAFVGEHFPGWRAELYLKDADVFKKAASREVALYTWTGVLVIVLILLAGGFAGQAVGKQIKLNRLKNDFIATVSHELKTPLASMRVLVDTLLEGRYKDQEQVTDYLQLVSKENERLTGLIDNFLTFSRMERNKQAFDFERVSPATIARDAADAVKTKFDKGKCKFDVSIGENLPDILVDRDAMVTVLVNLLDNAYKYSHDEKRIELSVSAEDGSICFCVSDNGIGLSRRAIKKMFNRFYQVDRSLTRPTEGCGLGLSIVKFIVDAHKGTISVDSKPDEGSTFTVKLPTTDLK